MYLFKSVKSKLFVFALCISLIPGFIITAIYYLHARNTIKHQILEELKAVAESKALHIISLMETIRVRTVDFSTDEFMRNNLEKIVRGRASIQHAVTSLNKHLTSMNELSLSRYLLASSFADKDGKVVSSTNKKLIGVDISDNDTFMQGIKNIYGKAYVSQPHYSIELDANCLWVSAPVFSRHDTNPLGIIINCYSLTVLNEITTNRVGMGNSGEVYLVNKDKIMFTESRFIDNAILKQVVDTKPVRMHIEECKETVGIYPDYRGVPVVGVSMNIKEYGWILLAEINESESFAPLKTLGRVVIILTIVVSITVICMGSIFAASISKPINDLTIANERFAHGELDYRIGVTSNDEIGKLAGSFNIMAEELERHHQHLESLVDQRAAELKTTNKQLFTEIAERKHIEEILRKYEILFSEARDLAYICDRNGNILFVNRIFGKLTGHKPENFSGKPFSALFDEKNLKMAMDNYTKTLGGESPQFELQFKDTGILCEYKNFPMRDAEGNINGVLGIARDITERKRKDEELKFLNESLEERVAERTRALVKANEKLNARIEEIKRAEAATRSSEEKFRQIAEHIQEVFWITSPDGLEIIYISPAYEMIWGRTCKSLYENPTDWIDAIHAQDRERVKTAFFGELNHKGYDEEYRIVRPDGSIRWIRDRSFPIKDASGVVSRVTGISEDITERKKTEDHIKSSNALLELFASKITRKEYLDAAVNLILSYSDCRGVGIRVVNKDGSIPYESYTGFSHEFWESENWLNINKDRCACTRVITGRPEPQDALVMTKFGSFYCNNTIKFIAGLSEDDRTKFRGVCVRSGYVSVAVIPIRYRTEILGAIHLADKSAGKPSPEKVEFLESMSTIIGEAVHRFNIEDELRQNYDFQAVVNNILYLALEVVPLDETLNRVLEYILSLPWLSFESKGCIFLVEDDPGILVMKAQKGLSESLKKTCVRVPLGRCLCGRAALTQEIQFADSIDSRHDILSENMEHHGHYCVPIIANRKVYGVLTLYLRQGYHGNKKIEEFLGMCTTSLAGIIEYRHTEGALRKTKIDLVRNIEKLEKALEGTIQALSLTLEKRDPYTVGHQRRVAQLAVAISRQMGITEDQIKGIHIAGIIHDVGKIYIPSEILSKPGELTDIEFSLIKTHPVVGNDILKNIEFPYPIAQIVHQHHEKINGSGYPSGLLGDKILLEAKIISVSDTVEAIASHRPYRQALGIDKALEEISINRGTLYDADVVDACLKVFKEEGFKF